MRVLVFGDSLVQGFYDTEGGWVARLRRYYDERLIKDLLKDNEPTIFNLGISGDKAENVLARMESEIKARRWPGEDLAFIFSIGVNDTVYRGTEFESTPEKYHKELQEILNVAKKCSTKILFAGLTPVVDDRVQPMAWSSTGKCYSSDRIWKFEETLREFCSQNHLSHVPLFEKIRGEQKNRELMPDGAHCNNDGHQMIFELVRPELDKLLNT